MDPSGPRSYGVLAEILSRGLAATDQAAAQAVEFGRLWGRSYSGAVPHEATHGRTALGQMVAVLDELGFAPEHDDLAADGHTRIGLRHCPFLELAESRPEVTCRAHLGVMQGLAEGWRAPFTVDRLDSFAEPDLCVVHLAANGDGE